MMCRADFFVLIMKIITLFELTGLKQVQEGRGNPRTPALTVMVRMRPALEQSHDIA